MTTRNRQQTSLARRLWTLRERAQVTQRKLAARAGMSWSVLQKIEQGVIDNPSLLTLRRLAQGFGISVSERLSGKLLLP